MESKIPSDSQYSGLTRRLPASLRPFWLLARFDRPIGWWLLFWPCAFALALTGSTIPHWPLLFAFLIGAIAMRGAGCVYNDIVDRDLDARVERTRARPLPSGAVGVRAAWICLILLCLGGLVILLMLPLPAQLVALASLALVAAYPFMKRISWWPQAWLGLVFSWGALVAWLSVAADGFGTLTALYAGCIFWVIGYDSVYAIQDIEDDALAGIKSSARAMGRHVRVGIGLFYALALISWGIAIWLLRPDWLALVALLPAAVHLGWQTVTLEPDNGDNALRRFRSNRVCGLLLFAGFFVIGQTGIAPLAPPARHWQADVSKAGYDMTEFRKLTPLISVAPQIGLDDVARAKAEGYTLIVNNRPDGEDPGAPQGADIAAAAEAEGMSYLAIPVTHAGFSAPQVEAMAGAISRMSEEGRILAYCRSGTRSTLLWALASAASGESPDDISAKAAAAGYDIAPVRPMVDGLAARSAQ